MWKDNVFHLLLHLYYRKVLLSRHNAISVIKQGIPCNHHIVYSNNQYLFAS